MFRNCFLLLSLFLLACSTVETPPTKIQDATLKGPQNVDPERDYAELFQAVQMGAVFPDSKTFADCSPLLSIKELNAAYATASQNKDFDLLAFVKENFQLPKQYSSGFVTDPNRSMEEHINALWPVLTRNGSKAELGSLLPLPNDYIVPGGRFGEIYYWDSYFTMLGLIATEQYDMVENMLDNFAHLIKNVGHIPNGNRTYFLHRSQPPFFAAMVNLLANAKGKEIYKKYHESLLAEYTFWMEGSAELSAEKTSHRRVVRLGNGTILNRYWDDRPEPRPESYKEDVALAEETKRDEMQLYRDLRAACESGWDFSTRWFADGKNLGTIETTSIIPVDLNCLLYNLEKTLSVSSNEMGDKAKADDFIEKLNLRKSAILHYCWDRQKGFFADYHWKSESTTAIHSMAGMFPLFFEIADQPKAQKAIESAKRDLLKPGGLMSTTITSGQQWDAPNGWAPLQWIGYTAFLRYDQTDLAKDLANRWLQLNEKVYKNTGKMVEKYNVLDLSLEAGGGEYPVQDGFGWSNGVALALMKANK